MIRASVDAVQSAIDEFVDGLPLLQKKQFNRVYALLKDLSLDADGNIKTTISNLKIITKVNAELEAVVDNPLYQDKVSELSKALDTMEKVKSAYFAQTFSDFTKPAAIAKIKEVAFDSTVNQLTASGVNENVVHAASEIVEDGITQGDSFFKMVDNLKTSILGNDKIDPKLISYAKTTINDALSGFSRNYNSIVSSDLESKWFMYVGALVGSSRPLCIALVHKCYIHVSELDQIARGFVDGIPVSREGLFPNTTGANFCNKCGGYGCNHEMIPISENMVPEHIRKNFK